MRGKEFKSIIENIPDDAEIVIRALLHAPDRIIKDDMASIESFTITGSDTEPTIILNPTRRLRGVTWQPENRSKVLCADCLNFSKISKCKKAHRDCFECNSPCRCRLCDTEDIKEEVMFMKRPMWEKKI